MPLKSNAERWGGVTQWLHWLMAIGIIGSGALGWYMEELPRGMAKINAYALHKSIGMTVLALLALRVAWRLYDRRPREEPMPRWQRRAAHAIHALMYLLMLTIPLSGWLYNSARGYPLQWFKWFNLPALVEKNAALGDFADQAHEVLSWILAGVLIAHAGASLVHHWFERDNTLLRMLPFARLRPRPDGEKT